LTPFLEAVENSERKNLARVQLANSSVTPDIRFSYYLEAFRRVRQITRNPHKRNIGRVKALK
jgi:hypothetical protein